MSEQDQIAALGAGSPQKPPEDLRTLLYWLANEDIYTSPYVRNWLKRTPREEAADVLAHISEYAQPESRSFFHQGFLGLLMMFTTAEVVTKKSPAGRKAGTRAAMLLANRNDLRSLAPLVRVFEPDWFWAGKYQAAIETALLQLLSEAEGQPEIRAHAEDLRNLANRIWRSGPRRADLSPRLTDLLLATLRLLKEIDGETDLALLKSLTEAKATQPNRARIKATATELLNSQ